MKKYKVCVYAITKNEEKFVERWYESMKEADKIVVLDTGSTDNTVNLLKKLGIEVHIKKYESFRFDQARNDSLALVPEDYEICVCTDLDEVFEPGWKNKLITVWNEEVNRVRYSYNWSFDEYGKPATTYLLNKIHKRDAFIWTHPVHEVLAPIKEEKEIACDDIVLNHYPDRTKSRSNYLPLLELSVNEDPWDDRNMHYLGREYMYYERYEDCIKTLKKHLELPSSTWNVERAASMRFIARSYRALKNTDECLNWYLKAIDEAPYMREAYIELAFVYYEEHEIEQAYNYLKRALTIDNKSKIYINEEFAWNGFIYDLLSICAYELGYYEEALENIKKAIAKDPSNIRLKMNLEEMERKTQK